jgi:hypothetical protein
MGLHQFLDERRTPAVATAQGPELAADGCTLTPCIDPAAIPPELKASARWVVWHFVFDPTRPKARKVPVNPRTLNSASPTDSGTWTSFDAAFDALTRHRNLAGLGYVLGDGVFGVDLDDSLGDDGRPLPWAQELLDVSGATYAEVSPSGRGLKLWARGELPAGLRHRVRIDIGELEAYDSRRYFTVTGRRLPGHLSEVREAPALLQRLTELLRPVESEPTPRRSTPTACMSNAELLTRARHAKNGAKFSALYDHGDLTPYGGDHSRADAALCAWLNFWADNDKDTVDKLFRASALYRPKWDEPRGSSTYGERTIMVTRHHHTYRQPERESVPYGNVSEATPINNTDAPPARPRPRPRRTPDETTKHTRDRLRELGFLVTPEGIRYGEPRGIYAVPVEQRREVLTDVGRVLKNSWHESMTWHRLARGQWYLLLKSVLRAQSAKALFLAIWGGADNPAALAEFARARAEARVAKVFWGQNTGTVSFSHLETLATGTLPEDRRKALLEECQSHTITVAELHERIYGPRKPRDVTGKDSPSLRGLHADSRTLALALGLALAETWHVSPAEAICRALMEAAQRAAESAPVERESVPYGNVSEAEEAPESIPPPHV